MTNALQDRPIFHNIQLQWIIPETPACRRCSDKNHSSKDCTLRPNIRQKVLTEPKFQKLAKLYERKHVLISTPANFEGTSWAEVVKRTTNKKPNHQPPLENGKNQNDPIEKRLTRMEKAINLILNHLKIEETEISIPLIPEQDENEAAEMRRTPEPKQNPSNKGKGPKTTSHSPFTPLAIIDAIMKGNEDPEKKITSLSQAFAKYYQETSLRMKHLENNMANILARFNYIEAEIEINHDDYQ